MHISFLCFPPLESEKGSRANFGGDDTTDWYVRLAPSKKSSLRAIIVQEAPKVFHFHNCAVILLLFFHVQFTHVNISKYTETCLSVPVILCSSVLLPRSTQSLHTRFHEGRGPV